MMNAIIINRRIDPLAMTESSGTRIVLKHKYAKMSVKYRVPGGQVVWTFMLWPCISVNLRRKMIILIYFIIHDLQMHSCKLEPEPLWGAFLQTLAKLFHKKNMPECVTSG